jgi:hypothetical protein
MNSVFNFSPWMRKVTKPACHSQFRQGIKKKISFHPLPTFLTAYVLRLLQPKSRFTPTPARLPDGKGRHFFHLILSIVLMEFDVIRQSLISGPRTYPDFIRILNSPNLQSCGLFLSIPESKQNLREKEKFRACEEITPSKLGFVKMMGEDKNQP